MEPIPTTSGELSSTIQKQIKQMKTNQNYEEREIAGSEPSAFKQMINSMAFKLFVVLILVLFLLIPMSWVSDLISERKHREQRVSEEIASKWGRQQVLSGPVVAIPFDYKVEKTKFDSKNNEVKTIETEREWIFVLPEQLDAKGEVSPEYLKRGIYKAVVYNTKLRFDGKFGKIDLDKIDLKGGEVKWGEAKAVLGISDFKGLLSFPKMAWGDLQLELDNSDKSFSIFEGNLIADLNLESIEDTEQTFHVDMQLRGSKSLNFLPLANQTNISISGNWSNPSFNGAFLPEERDIQSNSFTANWSVPSFSRKLAQQWQGSNQDRLYSFIGVNLIDEGRYYGSPETVSASGQDGGFGNSNDSDVVQIHFLPEVNEYQKITRVTKYGVLVILLTFASLILVEVIKKQRIHFIQYILIGVAMVLFYSLLLAMSEHLGFNLAYLIAALATMLLIASFIYMLTKKRGIAVVFGGILALFYGFIYFVMQLQDYSLIVGSIGVFVILAILMRFSAKINWYSLNNR